MAKECRLYNVFSSGASHGIYALFIKHSTLHNNGKAKGLVRGASNRFATWFIAMWNSLTQRGTLISLVHDPLYAKLDIVKEERTLCATKDVKNYKFWKAKYFLVKSVYAGLIALRYADSNESGMCKIYYLVHRVTESIKKYAEVLNDPDIFDIEDDGQVEWEREQVFGERDNDREDGASAELEPDEEE